MSGEPFGYGLIVGGSLLIWSGVTNQAILTTLKELVSGKKPTQGPKQSLVTGGSTSDDSTLWENVSSGVTTAVSDVSQSGSNQSYAKKLLGLYGWSDQWSDFNKLVNSESGWNSRVKNSSSGALGIAQALGHGSSATAGSLGNEYGGYGLSDAEAKAANSGNGKAQLKWMMAYIQGRYSSPSAAWKFHVANNWY